MRSPPSSVRARLRLRPLVLLCALLVPLAAVAAQSDGCIDCHAKAAAAERDHPHQRAGIGCVDCHGGDGKQRDKAAAKAAGTGYRGVIARQDVPALCGDCHADVKRMNPFGLPTDQLAQYRTSKHGEGLFTRSDTKVAVCVDCHGVHGVLEVRNPDSPVHPRHIADTCGRCHADAALMQAHNLEPTIVADYRQSVHAQLLAKGDLSAPQCATCHGNHGATPPGFAAVGLVCGKCHVRQKEFFQKSPHQKLVDKGDFNSCVVCHGNHKVLPAQEAIFNRACKVCHAAGDKALATRDQLVATLQRTSAAYARGKTALERARRLGLATDDDQVLLENGRTALLELQPAQHSLDPALIQPIAREGEAVLQRLEQRLGEAETFEQRKRLALVPVVLFLALMSFGSWLRYRRIHGHGTEARS